MKTSIFLLTSILFLNLASASDSCQQRSEELLYQIIAGYERLNLGEVNRSVGSYVDLDVNEVPVSTI